MASITCCKDCTERVLGCHSTCERYLEQKAQLTKVYKARKQEDIGYLPGMNRRK